jgi:hypothetical protein
MKIEDFNGIDYPIYFKSSCHYYKATGLNEKLTCASFVENHYHSIELSILTLDDFLKDGGDYVSQLEICTEEEFKEAFLKVLTLLVDLKTELKIK